jgi:hypothetical protein
MNGGAMKATPDERVPSVRREPLRTRFRDDLADLSPAYFGMVMATGIFSLVAHLLGMPRIA